MAESNGLLNRHRGNSIGGSNPPLSAIFFALMQAPKMKPEKASLHMPSGVLHKTAFQMKLVSFHSTMQSIYCCRCEAQESDLLTRRRCHLESRGRSCRRNTIKIVPTFFNNIFKQSCVEFFIQRHIFFNNT